MGSNAAAGNLSIRQHKGRAIGRALAAIAAAQCAAWAGPAAAQPAGRASASAIGTPNVAPVVVTASRTEQIIAEAIPHTTILTERDIRESQAADVLSLLRREAGFEFVQSGGTGSLSGVFMRGSEARQTLVLIDGLRVDSATAGVAALDQLLLDQIERIEIVRGNVSSLYGSGAVGGVIQVFTKRGKGPLRSEVQASAGSRQTYRTSGGVRGELGATSVSAFASGYRTDGFSALDPAQVPGINPDRDGYRNLTLSAQIGHRVGERLEVGARAYRSRGDIAYDSAFAASPADVHDSDNEVSTWSAFAKARPTERWLASLTVGEGRDRNDNFRNGEDDGRFETRNRQLTLDNEIDLGAGQRMIAGIERLEQRVDSSTPYTGSERNVNSGWLGYVGRFGAHQLQLNARHDRYSDFGSTTTWLTGYGYEITPQWKATAMASSAFSAPTFNFLYFPGFGNPDLQPERARSFELGAQYAVPGILGRLVWFRTDYRDLIQNVAPAFLPMNVAEARVDGVEASFTGTLLGIDWRVAATWQDPVSEPTGTPLLRRSREHGSVSVARSFGDWRIGVEVIASGSRPDISAADFARITLPGYALVNLTARWQVSREWWAGLRIDNALDRDYTLVSGYGTAGLGAFLTVGWNPGG